MKREVFLMTGNGEHLFDFFDYVWSVPSAVFIHISQGTSCQNSFIAIFHSAAEFERKSNVERKEMFC